MLFMRWLDQILEVPGGVFLFLTIAASLEVFGDAFFQSAVHRASSESRWLSVAAGALTLSCYGLVVNLPRWDFGKLLGLYVVFFFLVTQVVARVRFNQPLTPPVVVGGSMIVAGGAIIYFWKG